MEWFLVALGGGIGAVLRYCVIKLSGKLQLPVYSSTAFVNLFGSFTLGYAIQNIYSDILTSFLVIGLLGAFTTFSTFIFDLIVLYEEKQYGKLLFYLLINLIGGLFVFILGLYLSIY